MDRPRVERIGKLAPQTINFDIHENVISKYIRNLLPKIGEIVGTS